MPRPSPETPGPVVLLSSGRAGRQVGVNRADKPIYIDAHGELVCHHGERWASIQCWSAMQRADPTYRRPSRCDCVETDGLQSAKRKAVAPERLPPCGLQGEALWELAVEMDAPERWNYGRPQRLLHTAVDGREVWVGRTGSLLCPHGHSPWVLRKLAARGASAPSSCRKVHLRPCGCTKLFKPMRHGSIFSRGGTTQRRRRSREESQVATRGVEGSEPEVA